MQTKTIPDKVFEFEPDSIAIVITSHLQISIHWRRQIQHFMHEQILRRRSHVSTSRIPEETFSMGNNCQASAMSLQLGIYQMGPGIYLESVFRIGFQKFLFCPPPLSFPVVTQASNHHRLFRDFKFLAKFLRGYV